MDYFISVHPRSNVRFSALFLDPEEKSSFYPNDFPSMILQKIICVFHDNMANENVPSSFTATTETTSTLPPPQQSTVHREIWTLLYKNFHSCDPVISMVTERPDPTPHTTNHTSSSSNVFDLLLKRHFKRSLEVLVGARKIEMDKRLLQRTVDASFKDSEINALKIEIEKLKNEKESNQIKINKFENASKSLDKLIGSQKSDNSRKGVGYNAVPPPPTGLFAPSIIDLPYSGLEEFQQPAFEGYRPKVSESVYVDTSNKVKKTSDTPLVEELVSEKEKQTIFPKQQDKTVRKPVKYAEMYRS
ncbi:hypothetical protein Tco_0986006 [Tanacetum coccineum]